MALAPSPSSNRLAGLASITVGGTTYMLVGDFIYRPSTVTRETLAGMDGIHGFKETPAPGRIEATIRDAGGLSVNSFNNMVNVSVVGQLANGKTIVGNSLWTTEPPEVNAVEGSFKVIFEGVDVSETEA